MLQIASLYSKCAKKVYNTAQLHLNRKCVVDFLT